MKRALSVGLTAALALAGLGAGSALATASAANAPTAVTAAAIDPQAASDLAFSREEERMARDLYKVIADKYDQARPFSNITYSEQRHFDNIGALLTRYGVADPSAGKPVGTYANAELQKLYDGWKARAMTSLAEAHKVGIELEKRDIADLKGLIGRTTQADITMVYERLLWGSENHLAAFTAASQGKTMGARDGSGVRRQGGPAQGPGAGQRQGQGPHWSQDGQRQQGPRWAQQGQGPGRLGDQGGYGRTGRRPADCPMA